MFLNLFRKNNNFWPDMKWHDWLMLGGAVAAFIGLAASTITKFSIWFDESFGSYLVRFNIFELTRYTAFDVHPPFYYWLLKVWTMVFGNTEIGLRSMSVFFGVLTIILAFLLVFRLFGRKAAYLSLIFIVLSPLFLRYSQEARMYTVLTAVVLLATYVLLYAQEHSKKRWPWVTYGILLAIGMLTQYFAALAWLAHWVWRYFAVRSHGDSWRETKRKFFTKQWVQAHIIAIGIFLPWLPFLVWQFVIVQGFGFWIPPLTASTVSDFLTNTLLFTDSKGTQGWLALGFYTTLIATTYFVVRLLKKLDDEHRKRYLLIVCMVVVPLILLIIASMPPFRPAFVDRYLMVSVTFLPLLFAVSLAHSKDFMAKKFRIFLGLVVIVMMVFGINNQMNLGNYNKSTNQSNNIRQLVEAVRAANPNASILSNTPWIFYEAIVYEKANSPIYFADETTIYEFGSLQMLKENDQFKVKDVDAFARTHSSFWLIANLRNAELKPLRSHWHAHESITINDDVSNQPLFKATRYSVK